MVQDGRAELNGVALRKGWNPWRGGNIIAAGW